MCYNKVILYYQRKKAGEQLQDLLYLDSSIYVKFLTHDGQRSLVARDLSYTVPAGSTEDFNKDLLAVQTQNDTQQDIPSASIALTDDHNWQTLLTPNDYVEIGITYHSNIFSKEAKQDKTFILYTGLISDIKRTDDASNNSRTYVVATQGMAKVLQNINLGSFTEITSETIPMFPDEEGQGIKVSGRSSANIIAQIFDRFVWKDIINYNFGIGGNQTNKLKDLLKTTDSQGNTTLIGNIEEAQTLPKDGVSFLGNYNGTLLQMIKDTASRPFNELYWTHEEGKATFHYRPTPFDQPIWKTLPYIVIEPNAVIKQDLDTNDQDQASVFKITPSEDSGQDTSNWIDGMFPITDEGNKLISNYGYKIMNVSTDYFSGVSNEDSSSKVANGVFDTAPSQTVTNEEQAKKHYPPYVSILDALSTQSNSSLSKSKLKDASMPDGISGERDYSRAKEAIKGTKQHFIEIVGSATHKISKQDASALWDRYNLSKNELSREQYLQAIYPGYYVPITPGTVKQQKLTHLYSISAMKKHPKEAANQLIQVLNRTIGAKQAYEIIKACIAKGDVIDDATYFAILQKYKYNDSEDGVSDTGVKGANENVAAMIEKYTEKLFNWYADNGKFISGTVTINGTSGVEVGKRLYIRDTNDDCYYEFYIESVSHAYSFTSGWTIDIGVTRGMPVEKINSDRRFQQPYSFYGAYQRFNGGYFGEEQVSILQEKARTKAESGGSSDDSGDDESGDGSVKVSNKTDSQWGCYSYLIPIAKDAMAYGKKISGQSMSIQSGYRAGDPYGHGYRQAVDIAFPTTMNGSPYYTKVGNYIFKKYSKYIAYVICDNKVKDRSGLSGTGSSGNWVNWAQGGHLNHMHINGIYGNWGSSKRIK